jgi:hypothetical protein
MNGFTSGNLHELVVLAFHEPSDLVFRAEFPRSWSLEQHLVNVDPEESPVAAVARIALAFGVFCELLVDSLGHPVAKIAEEIHLLLTELIEHVVNMVGLDAAVCFLATGAPVLPADRDTFNLIRSNSNHCFKECSARENLSRVPRVFSRY